MRKTLMMTCAAVLVLGIPAAVAAKFNATCQFAGAVNPQVSHVVVSLTAGPALASEVARLVEADPSLVDDFVFLARGASSAQKLAIAAGLAEAAKFFAACAARGDQACRRAERQVLRALECADQETRSAFLIDVGTVLADVFGRPGPVFIPDVGGGGVGGGGCITVSPSRPGC